MPTAPGLWRNRALSYRGVPRHMTAPLFTRPEPAAIYRAIRLGRDMHHFLPGSAVELGEGCPPDAQPVALPCLGRVREFRDRPMLKQVNWQRKPAHDMLMQGGWGGESPC